MSYWQPHPRGSRVYSSQWNSRPGNDWSGNHRQHDWDTWRHSSQADEDLHRAEQPSLATETPFSSAPIGSTEPPISYGQGWTTGTATSNYSAVYGAESPTKAGGTKKPRLGGTRSSTSSGDNPQSIKGRTFEHAFIGKEKEQYVREALRPQIDSGLAVPSVSARESAAPSPIAASALTPHFILEEFRRGRHLDDSRTQLSHTFQSSEHKEALLESLQSHLLKKIAQLTPDARQKLANQDSRLQELEVNRWIMESPEAAGIVDDMFRKMRAKREGQDGWFEKEGVIGKAIERNLVEVIANEKQRREQKKAESSDEEDIQTPQHKGNSTPAQDSFSRGSQTPKSLAAAEGTPESRETIVL